MSTHYRVICKECGTVIGECRCPSKDKFEKYDTCEKCKGENKDKT